MKKFVIMLSVVAVVAGFAVAFAIHEAPLTYESILRHMPRPSAGDLRYHMTIHKSYLEWAEWPGKGKMYKGQEPHGAFLTTYVNETALDSIKKAKGMADHSIIVKENYDTGKKLTAVTVMYKVRAYNPEGGDWFWVKYDPDFNVLGEGKIKACLDCHGTVKDNDYIFTGKVTEK